MKKDQILILAHNTRSAGTLNYTKNLIDTIDEHSNYLITIPNQLKTDSEYVIKYKNSDRLFFKLLYSIWNNLKTYLIIKKVRPKKVIVLGNYFVNPFKNIETKILVRHPYLLAPNSVNILNKKRKLEELVRKEYFKLTLRTNNHIVIQNKRFENIIRDYYNFKGTITVLYNAIYGIDNYSEQSISERENIFIYPSRYYEHKNHIFLIKFVSKFLTDLKKHKIKIILTIEEETLDLRKFDIRLLKEVIIFLGEIKQKDLFDVYSQCKGIIFPSNEETFGNGLVEGLLHSLPIAIINRPYATTLLGNYGFYFDDNSFDELRRILMKIISFNEEDIFELNKKRNHLLQTFDNFQNWLDKISY